MTGNASWIFIVIVGAIIGVYYLWKQGKISWLKGKGMKMPKMFEPKAETQIEKLKAQTEKEVEKAEKLKGVLEAKTELAKARAENIRLLKQIDGVNVKSVVKEKEPVPEKPKTRKL